MPRPSMFSRDYEKLMRRRRLNITLVILIILSASFFGIRYYLQNNNMSLLDDIFKKPVNNQKNDTSQPTPEPTQNPAPTPTQGDGGNITKQESFYEFKSSNGEVYKIVYETAAEGISITGIKSSYDDLGYDISQDKQLIAFEDRAASDIIVMDADGKATKVSPDSYTSKSTGSVIMKQSVLNKNPNYTWSSKPHFTSDNKIVYITDLPYIYDDGKLYMWATTLAGGRGKMIGEFDTEDNASINYEGYREDGSLIISFNNISYYYKPNASKLSQ